MNDQGAYDELGGQLPDETARETGKRAVQRVREVLERAEAPLDVRLCEICSHKLKYHARGRCFHPMAPDERDCDCGAERGDTP